MSIGNAVEIRDSARCCKFQPDSMPEQEDAFEPLASTGWEGASTGASQKTCIHSVNR